MGSTNRRKNTTGHSHALALYEDDERIPCRAGNRQCFYYCTHVTSWIQRVGGDKQRRVSRPVCKDHAREFAARHGLEVPERG